MALRRGGMKTLLKWLIVVVFMAVVFTVTGFVILYLLGVWPPLPTR